MPRIYVDFNTLNSEPIDMVKIGQDGIDAMPKLHDGEQVVLYDEEMEVAATVSYDAVHGMWLAVPDWSTRADLADASTTV